MAQSNNSSGNKPRVEKLSSGKKVSEQAARIQQEAYERNARRRNIWSIFLFAAGVLLICFAFIGDISVEEPSMWDHIHGFLCGLFGMAVFLVGPVVIYVAVMLSADKKSSTIRAKMFQLVLIILLICAAAQVIFVGDFAEKGTDFAKTIQVVYERGTQISGGGLAGMVFGVPLMLFGRVGASIILVLIAFVTIMLIANIKLADFLRFSAKPFKSASGYAKKKREEYRAESEYVQLELERIEEERRAALLTSSEQPVHSEIRTPKISARNQRKIDKFAAIAAVTTSAQQPVSEEEKQTAQEKPKEIEEQSKENQQYQKDLRDFLSGSVISSDMQEPVQTTIDDVIVPSPAVEDDSDGPFCPDGGFVVGSTDVTGDAVAEAIADFNREQSDNAAEKAENAEKLAEGSSSGTVITTDKEGQAHFEEIVSAAEQYTLPPVDLLNDIVRERSTEAINEEINVNAKKLVDALKSFGVETKFLEASRGPSVTRYELQPAPGVKISKITGLVDDIALNLATAGVRIEAPIPNKAAVGIEVPNKQVDSVPIRSMIDSEAFKNTKSKLGAALGMDITGEIVVADIAKMPHILIAGTTGSGKSVCVNSIIMSILFRSTPDEVRLLMIDPKAVEFMIYNGIPHLLIPVVTDPKKAAGALAWAVTEMLNRYKLFSDNNVRDIDGYNHLAKTNDEIKTIPQIVIFIDELADLMMASPGEVEDSICRLAQMARAAGMHLVIATQRPSVNVVTGVIKANIPSRIALKVASQVDSRTIIDSAGAEKLLGKGDMLYFPVGMPKPMRVQGCWVSDKEVERVSDFIKNSFILDYDQSVIEEIEKQAERAAEASNAKAKDKDSEGGADYSDDKLDEAIEAVIEAGQASTSYLQRKLKLGYGRAARIIDTMEEMGIVGAFEGGKPRQVLMTKQEWYERKLRQSDEE